MSQVAIVILNYNGKHYLEQFLPTVLTHSSGHEVWVADNASTDGSMEWLRAHHPEVHLLQITDNKGYAGGYNYALKAIEASYYVLLNSDVEVTPGWIEPVIAYMKSDPQIAACQPKIRAHDLRSHFEYAGAAGGYMDYLGYPFCRGRSTWATWTEPASWLRRATAATRSTAITATSSTIGWRAALCPCRTRA